MTGHQEARVVVTTTLPALPLPPNSMRGEIRTSRLLLRPLCQEDLQGLHALRSQPEVMMGTARGVPDKDMGETEEALQYFLAPNDEKTFLFGAFLLTTGELVGEGGIHSLASSSCGWPEIGYKFSKEVWRQGYAFEFVQAMLQAWWELPRSTATISVHPQSCGGVENTHEQVFALTDDGNVGSQGLLAKLGFRRFMTWTEPDTQLHRLGQPVTLHGFAIGAPKAS
ncbi:GNAT domain-containing protein [Stachybotrys elegans]|uniref:GNAT domain-containing protein n=1 Tax=Stachybotrys elegans TaxID=80388 RepID=A0A8K0WKS4_9HYPO|nr:GNAT domain-containing protein [Stachybotrys elegans]